MDPFFGMFTNRASVKHANIGLVGGVGLDISTTQKTRANQLAVVKIHLTAKHPQMKTAGAVGLRPGSRR
jgi:hypothetical protein